MDGIDYVFADINCRLNVKFNDGKFRVFNFETELANIISNLDSVNYHPHSGLLCCVLVFFFVYKLKL